MNTMVYIVLLFVLAAAVLFGLLEVYPKIRKLNNQVHKNITTSLNDKSLIAKLNNQGKQSTGLNLRYSLIAIIFTIFILSIFYVQLANNWMILILIVIEAIYIINEFKNTNFIKKLWQYDNETLKLKQQSNKLTFFTMIGIFIAVDVFELLFELLYEQGFTLL
ncbi:hypothetical protein [Apilactobacillus timberlakei]|uniref:Uncharacterized protein n=1 Tax=Apilactobacillus timberlakei TaxID=2008380 RepID=A0ABY2YUB3_9LACO|nr:hypothetical protein [Apilactobacillus timberlakei]TPR14734.1 hypothetical protein DYZ97_00960 [Apilactobacillus timberlakei]TPR15701.1 hypothetical protein DY052_03745 [Apilactobacillus timberlakei]TPR16062.1 hypothetical protein DY048_00960 [Apilactobacillus timberlakei]TPR18249.1 hypothetical protein DYZ95_02820 [Apilactobacillus timberlakei]TPR18804.1 hypothetical protein DY138_04085 [Apilactobacillus timberlakei]